VIGFNVSLKIARQSATLAVGGDDFRILRRYRVAVFPFSLLIFILFRVARD